MKSLYGQYLAEREGFGIVESSSGFATYGVSNGGCIYLRDLYVIPECRKNGIASALADEVCEIGKSCGCDTLLGSVSKADPRKEENTKVLFAYGMRIKCETPDMIYFEKEL